jgi:hypothetical protein
LADKEFVRLQRSMPFNLPFDLLDIAMGTGYVSVPLAIMATVHAFRLDRAHPVRRFVFLSITQVLMAVAVCLFPGEEARLFIVFMPFIAAVMGIELVRWRQRWRYTVYFSLWLITVCVAQNMIFINQGDIDRPTRRPPFNVFVAVSDAAACPSPHG